MKTLFLITALLIITATVNAQQITPEQIANNRLAKAMDVIDKQDAQLKAQQKQIDDILALVDAIKGENTALKVTNNVLLAQNQDLSKLKSDKISILFGLIKFTRSK